MKNIAPALALVLFGCGPELGSHVMVSAERVDELPTSLGANRNDPGYLRLEFRTDADLNAADINALYAKASACPYDDRRRMPALGPLSLSQEPEYLPLRRDKRGSDISSYLVFVPTVAKLRGPLERGKSQIAGTYDLAGGQYDLCVVIEHTGYPIARLANVVRIPHAKLREALR